jgi:hypothetical protein
MSYVFSPALQGIVRQYTASGGYASEDELLLDAFAALRQRDEDCRNSGGHRRHGSRPRVSV